MSDLTIRINMDNAAFCDCPELEVSRILKDYAEKIEKYGLDHEKLTLHDFNGNNIGTIEFEKKDL